MHRRIVTDLGFFKWKSPGLPKNAFLLPRAIAMY